MIVLLFGVASEAFLSAAGLSLNTLEQPPGISLIQAQV